MDQAHTDLCVYIPSCLPSMPLVHVTWLPKACRTNPAVRKEVAKAIIKAMTSADIKNQAEIKEENLVVRFSEAVDGFALPQGHTYESLDLEKDRDA